MYNLDTLKLELEGIPDAALVEECIYYGENFQCDDLNEIGLKFGYKGKITEKERKKLENIYILMYTDISWEA
tara:strand:+ start:134 stop:349 length:216 start_codon:yes stop_codon:yes gene_type:complete